MVVGRWAGGRAVDLPHRSSHQFDRMGWDQVRYPPSSCTPRTRRTHLPRAARPARLRYLRRARCYARAAPARARAPRPRRAHHAHTPARTRARTAARALSPRGGLPGAPRAPPHAHLLASALPTRRAPRTPHTRAPTHARAARTHAPSRAPPRARARVLAPARGAPRIPAACRRLLLLSPRRPPPFAHRAPALRRCSSSRSAARHQIDGAP